MTLARRGQLDGSTCLLVDDIKTYFVDAFVVQDPTLQHEEEYQVVGLGFFEALAKISFSNKNIVGFVEMMFRAKFVKELHGGCESSFPNLYVKFDELLLKLTESLREMEQLASGVQQLQLQKVLHKLSDLSQGLQIMEQQQFPKVQEAPATLLSLSRNVF